MNKIHRPALNIFNINNSYMNKTMCKSLGPI